MMIEEGMMLANGKYLEQDAISMTLRFPPVSKMGPTPSIPTRSIFTIPVHAPGPVFKIPGA